MNWVGGRRQRHSKTDANTKIKAQKQYFANVRKNLSRQSKISIPSSFSILQDPAPDEQGFRDVESTIERQQDAHAEQKLDVSTASYKINPVSTTADIYVSHSTEGDQAAERDALSRPNTIVDVKQNLLQRPDWTGLAPTKPVEMSFPTSQERQGFARHRRRIEGRGGYARAQAHNNLTKSMDQNRHHRSPQHGPFHKGDNISIRFGSNLHRTQTTRTTEQHFTPNILPSTNITDSRIPEKTVTSQSMDQDLESSRELERTRKVLNVTDGETSKRLVPLNDACRFENFDALLEHASSTQWTPPGLANPQSATSHTNMRTSQAEQQWQSSQASYHSRSNLVDPSRSTPAKTKNSIGEVSSVAQTHYNGLEGRTTSQTSRSHIPLFSVLQPASSRPSFSESNIFSSKKRIYDGDTCQADGFPNLDAQSDTQMSVLYAKKPRYTMDNHRSSEQYNDLGIPSQFQQLPAIKHNKISGLARMGSASSQQEDIPASTVGSHHTLDIFGDAGRRLSLREKFQQAKNNRERNSTQVSPDSMAPLSGSDHLGDQNETWMRHVFPQDFHRIQNGFTFGLSPSPINLQQPSKTSLFGQTSPCIREAIHDGEIETETESEDLVSLSAPTTANVALFSPMQASFMNMDRAPIPSETDFLTQLSPMTGLLDERIRDVSIYNNASRTERSFIPLQLTEMALRRRLPEVTMRVGNVDHNPLKRKALAAFEMSSPKSQVVSQTAACSRRPLRPLPNSSLWTDYRTNGIRVVQRNLGMSLKSFFLV